MYAFILIRKGCLPDNLDSFEIGTAMKNKSIWPLSISVIYLSFPFACIERRFGSLPLLQSSHCFTNLVKAFFFYHICLFYSTPPPPSDLLSLSFKRRGEISQVEMFNQNLMKKQVILHELTHKNTNYMPL